MSYQLDNKLIIVAGGEGALGGAIVADLLNRGAEVIATRRSNEKSTTKNPRFVTLNALDEEGVRKFFSNLPAAPAGLVNVVGGYAAGEPVSDLPLSVFEAQIDINLKSAFLLTKHAISAMQAEGGKIVHVASRAATEKGKNSFAYSFSKLGVLRLVEATAAEVLQSNININAVMPSIFDTAANRNAMPDADFSRWPRTEQIASVIAFLLSPDADLISGAAIPVYGKA